ncbi:relaxase/mobilization nuclease RlxS [Sphingomonas sp. HF-S4]|uniref:Relaxase/mobilization nuclease RlxS n=1 Tax=Sphingomonas agrestis TaxID=3080540 RepID=A0ABU3Y3C5_9SPHN|nr:relaxase/mobilization nuclease RlxS [Sphingomonas sp. HF-S4]MDV3455870.1 relaxase/mobilization nuclease RlxS [Sphingomonas sp. HF-S4]
MSGEDDFEPRLGRMRAGGSKGGRSYLHRVLQAAGLAGSANRGGSGFHGNRIGRGAGIGRLLASGDALGRFRHRRVIVKSRLVRLAGRGAQGARAHMRYIQRDGVTRDGTPGELYGAERDVEDGKAFLDRSTGDRHQFRFIVSAEDGAEYDDLKPLTRALMARMEQDLGTRLDWVAVDHFNTGHPHTHVLLRGRDDRGRDLIIAREYLSAGMRERAAEIVSMDLGPRSDLEVRRRLLREMEQERWTGLDRQLVAAMDSDRWTQIGRGSPVLRTALTGRLAKLERLGLAEHGGAGRWRLAGELEPTLRRMGERCDIIKTMHCAMRQRSIEFAGRDLAVFEPTSAGQGIVGRIVARGLSDELRDRHYLIVEATDGRTHYVDVGKGEALEPLPEGTVVGIAARRSEPRAVDRTVAEVAARNGGRYSVDLHLRHDPSATQAFAETHVRRLEAIRRHTGGADREVDGSWRIHPDHLARVAAFEQRQARDRPVDVKVLSRLPLEAQIAADGPTWLDTQLLASDPVHLRDAGFGAAARDAQRQRLRWLIGEGLAEERGGGPAFQKNLVEVLRRRELLRVAGQLSDELGKAFAEVKNGEPVSGVLRRHIDLASGRYGVVEKARDFTLVPWRPVLERQIGKAVRGIMRERGVSWTMGRERGPSL